MIAGKSHSMSGTEVGWGTGGVSAAAGGAVRSRLAMAVH
jgi:hypothetical protein